MQRTELIEWIVMIGVIVAWWPRVFMGYDPLWYHVLVYYVTPLALIVIFVRRYRRMEKGLEYSQKVMDERHKASGANILGYPPVPTGGPEERTEDKRADNGDEA